MEINSKSEDEDMSPLKDASDMDGDECSATSESLMVRWALNVYIKEDDLVQYRTSIFHTWYYMHYKVFNLIIYGGSYTNIASTILIDKLGLPTIKHTTPYMLQWLNYKGEVKVDS